MFTLTRETALPPEELWLRVSALEGHADTVPLTTTITPGGEPTEGWQFTVRTALGPVRFDDTMVVDVWDPPRQWRVRKTGGLAGWAQVVVMPYAGGSRLTWTEELWLGLPGLRRITTGIGDLVGPIIFGRVVDRLVAVGR